MVRESGAITALKGAMGAVIIEILLF